MLKLQNIKLSVPSLLIILFQVMGMKFSLIAIVAGSQLKNGTTHQTKITGLKRNFLNVKNLAVIIANAQDSYMSTAFVDIGRRAH